MSRSLSIITSALVLLSSGPGVAEPQPVMDADALLKLAPCISLEEESISTFEVKGTMDLGAAGLKLKFIVAGKQPDQLALTVVDPRDKTPVLIGVGESSVFYDPILSEVVLGRAVSSFLLARMVLAGIDAPDIRQAVEKMSGKELDWERLKEKDKKAGEQLRKVFGGGGEGE